MRKLDHRWLGSLYLFVLSLAYFFRREADMSLLQDIAPKLWIGMLYFVCLGNYFLFINCLITAKQFLSAGKKIHLFLAIALLLNLVAMSVLTDFFKQYSFITETPYIDLGLFVSILSLVLLSHLQPRQLNSPVNFVIHQWLITMTLVLLVFYQLIVFLSLEGHGYIESLAIGLAFLIATGWTFSRKKIIKRGATVVIEIFFIIVSRSIASSLLLRATSSLIWR